jgi:hypothetical protein
MVPHPPEAGGVASSLALAIIEHIFYIVKAAGYLLGESS